MTNYRRGADFERRVKANLLDRGAAYVSRSAGSRSPVDLIAIWPWGVLQATIWFVQCKRDGRLSSRDEIELISLAEKAGARPVLAHAGKSGRGIEFVSLPHTKPEERTNDGGDPQSRSAEGLPAG